MAFRSSRPAAVWVHGQQVCQRGTSCQGHGCFVKRATERRGKDLKRAAKIHQESGLLTPIVFTSSTPEVTFSREEGSRRPAALERAALVPRAESRAWPKGLLALPTGGKRGVEGPRAAHTWPCASALRGG